MRFDITQPISHQSKTLLDFALAKVWRADEAQEHDAERQAKSCDQYQVVADYHTSRARTQAGTVNRDLGVDRRWVGRDPWHLIAEPSCNTFAPCRAAGYAGLLKLDNQVALHTRGPHRVISVR
jgi:hypothetical protein